VERAAVTAVSIAVALAAVALAGEDAACPRASRRRTGERHPSCSSDVRKTTGGGGTIAAHPLAAHLAEEAHPALRPEAA
jgi:hypothetical protein